MGFVPAAGVGRGGRTGTAGVAGRVAHAGAGGRTPLGASGSSASSRPGRAEGSRSARGRFLMVLSVVLSVAGALALAYPFVANWMAGTEHERVVQSYDEAAAQRSQAEFDAAWQEAQQYNESLVGQPVHDPFVPGSGYAIPDNYEQVLNLNGDGVMGSLEIPKIGVDLPIYHGTSDDALDRGVGHVEATSLPIGGASTHAVLTGHRGLPQAELFTRLDELAPGDTFVIDVLGQKLAYRVYATETVLPTELDSLAVHDGRDLVTLVTCTPYGVNTHRLLVHAERTEYTPDMEDAADQGFHLSTDTLMRLAGAGLGLVLLAVCNLVARRGRAR